MSSGYKRAIVILADGARFDVISSLILNGRLHNIKKHLVDRGSINTGITSFPSTTGPAYLPYLTGCMPSTCNVPGIRWFEKSKYGLIPFRGHRSYVGLESFLLSKDIDKNIKSIFDILPNAYSIFNPVTKGRLINNVTKFSRIWYWYYAHLTNSWAACDDEALIKLKKVTTSQTSFVFVVFPGIDEFSHLTNPHHISVLKRYEWLDLAIGDFCDDLKKKNLYDDTAIFLVSDHGLSATHTHFCVNYFLEEHNCSPFYYPRVFNKRNKVSANMISGNGMTHIYFKDDDRWNNNFEYKNIEIKYPNLISDLVREDAVDIVAVRDEGGWIRIKSKLGEAMVRLNNNVLDYLVLNNDPFGYTNEIPASLTKDECLKLTFDSNHPDAPYQIAHLFKSKRSGDLIISATEGYDLRQKYESPEHKSSHGSLVASHMKVPVITNIKLSKNIFRTVDVFPSIMNLLGKNIELDIDGKNLI